MSHSGTIFLCIILAFLIFVVMRGELPKYLQVFL